MKKPVLIALLLFVNFSILLAPDVRCAVLLLPSPINITQTYLKAIILVETGEEGSSAINPNEPQAVGILQEWPIMVKDVNRILGKDVYTLEDRLDDNKAVEMFWIYQSYYNPTYDFEKMCKIWCGGPNGMNKASTEDYYQRVLGKINVNLLTFS